MYMYGSHIWEERLLPSQTGKHMITSRSSVGVGGEGGGGGGNNISRISRERSTTSKGKGETLF